LGKIIKRGKYDLAIMTSRYGKPLTHILGKIKKQWKKAHKVFLAFGSPKEGLREILKKENTGIEEVADFVVNTIPQQGTKTIRTEEAIYATLAISNITMK
jgi:predicted SPOUT superfamily RNA methylase MTH1